MALSRAGIDPIVYLNGYEAAGVHCLAVETSLGGRRAEHARIEIVLGRGAGVPADSPRRIGSGRLLADDIAGFGEPLAGALCEIVFRVAGQADRVVHWGTLDVTQLQLDDRRERMTCISRAEPWHFGNPLGYQEVYEFGQGVLRSDQDVVFNPTLRGVPQGNRYAGTFPTAGGGEYFADPEGYRTPLGGQAQGGTLFQDPNDRIGRWSLRTAARYVCRACNPDETFFANPPDDDFALLPDDETQLAGLALPPEDYLPQALDRLLSPYGWTWRVEYVALGVRRLRIVGRGRGALVSAHLQTPGAVLNTTDSDAAVVALDLDLGQIRNQVRVVGGFTAIEASFVLEQGWDTSLDELANTNLADLIPRSAGWLAHPEWHAVHRKWVLNEAGDYGNALGGWISIPFDLTSLFRLVWAGAVNGWQEHPTLLRKRRRFLPTLATDAGISSANRSAGGEQRATGRVGGCTVEWWNENKVGGAGWERIDHSQAWWQCEILEEECGVLFTGELPPMPLVSSVLAGASFGAHVRVTAVVESDTRLSWTATRRANSPLPDVAELLLDMPQSFAWRQPVTSGTYASIFATGYTSLAVDDRAAISEFAQAVRREQDAAEIAGDIVLEGLDRTDFVLGKLLVNIAGRGIGLETSELDIAHQWGYKYPQIVGLRYEISQQRTYLTLETFRDSASAFRAQARPA